MSDTEGARGQRGGPAHSLRVRAARAQWRLGLPAFGGRKLGPGGTGRAHHVLHPLHPSKKRAGAELIKPKGENHSRWVLRSRLGVTNRPLSSWEEFPLARSLLAALRDKTNSDRVKNDPERCA